MGGETSEGSETVPAAELPQRCVQRLMRELRTLARGETVADGIDLALFDPTGNDMRVWALKIHTRSIDPDCLLGKELRRLDILAVELELWIPDEFPSAHLVFGCSDQPSNVEAFSCSTA